MCCCIRCFPSAPYFTLLLSIVIKFFRRNFNVRHETSASDFLARYKEKTLCRKGHEYPLCNLPARRTLRINSPCPTRSRGVSYSYHCGVQTIFRHVRNYFIIYSIAAIKIYRAAARRARIKRKRGNIGWHKAGHPIVCYRTPTISRSPKPCRGRRIEVIGIKIKCQCSRYLTNINCSPCIPCLCPCRIETGKYDTCKQADNRNNNEKFNKSKTLAKSVFHRGRTSGVVIDLIGLTISRTNNTIR